MANSNSIAQLHNLLKGVAKNLSGRTIFEGKQVPILFIDEANRLQAFLRDKHGQTALESLFQYGTLHKKVANYRELLC